MHNYYRKPLFNVYTIVIIITIAFMEMAKDKKVALRCQKLMATAMRTSYYVFTRGHKDWDDHELVALQKVSFLSCGLSFLIHSHSSLISSK